MWLLQQFLPLYQFVQPPVAYSGIILVLAGILVSAVSAGMFKKAHTGIRPFEEATALITGGFYRYSRNPMYLGMFLMLLGMVILLGEVVTLAPVLVFMFIIRNHFVLAEEQFMEAAFGQKYLEYKASVRRWL